MDDRGGGLAADAAVLDDDGHGQAVGEADEPGVGVGRVGVAELGRAGLAGHVETGDRGGGAGAGGDHAAHQGREVGADLGVSGGGSLPRVVCWGSSVGGRHWPDMTAAATEAICSGLAVTLP